MTSVPVDEVRNRALRVAAWSEVNDVRLFESSSKLKQMPETHHLKYDMHSDVSMQYVEDEGGLIVTGDYSIIIREAEGEVPSSESDDEVEPVYELTFQLAALFDIDVPEGAEPLSHEELDSFARTTGQFALHPYAREFVAEMTGRAGLPALHVGMLKIHLDGPNPRP